MIINYSEGSCIAAGFWAYLVSRWPPERRAKFYGVHRFLGSATLLTAFTAIIAGLMQAQAYGSQHHGPHSLASILIPIMGLIIVVQGVVIVSGMVHGQQALPAVHATPALNGREADSSKDHV